MRTKEFSHNNQLTAEQLVKQRHYERVCAYIDLDAILFNMRSMHAHLPKETKITAVVKTDGYGHGSVAIAKTLEQEDYIWGYATATEEEAMQLRGAGLKKPIMILGYSFPYAYDDIAKQEIRPAVFSVEMAKELSEAAVRGGKEINIHIKVDTGMGRIGVRPDESGLQIVRTIANLPGLVTEGIFTHFAKADETDKTHTREQYRKFTEFTARAEQMLGRKIPIHHCANSAGIVDLPQMHLTMVRAGITLYGLWPSDEVNREAVALKPVMSIKSHVVYIKKLHAGETVSYGGTYTAPDDRIVATIPVGYGDGYPRGLSGKGCVLINGRRCPILGRVCMDQFMADITDVPDVSIGTEVTLIGTDGTQQLTMEELGALSGRFNYELACDIGKRVPRVFVKDGKAVAYKDYYEDVPTVYME
ncbi:MAG: alanine racemase [Lachnospiraceae bacterium]